MKKGKKRREKEEEVMYGKCNMKKKEIRKIRR